MNNIAKYRKWVCPEKECSMERACWQPRPLDIPLTL